MQDEKAADGDGEGISDVLDEARYLRLYKALFGKPARGRNGVENGDMPGVGTVMVLEGTG